jgi:uncharacterized protein
LDKSFASRSLHVMAKPTGSVCNLDCAYCFFLQKERLYPGGDLRMDEGVMEEYLRQYIHVRRAEEVIIAWQGGEPTLMGLDFFRGAVETAAKHAPEGMRVSHTIQTNGTLLDEEWCEFLRDNGFLVGLSLDGPRELHDRYRVDKSGRGTFDRVMRAARLMQQRGVDFNILCSISAANSRRPLDIYRFFRDELGARWIQFIPIVERVNSDGSTFRQEGDTVTDRSVDPREWGDFLVSVFDEWVRGDVGSMFVNFFDAAVAAWLGAPPAMCIFDETCGNAPVLEHNGDLYTCDHFVEPDYLLGNILERPLAELVASDRMRAFGEEKRGGLPHCCRSCEVLFACRGECPKNRFAAAPDGEPGLNYLCAGYKAFFNHIDPIMRVVSDLLREGRYADEIIGILAEEEASRLRAFAGTGRNDPCPCGSGRKFKVCHGKG